MKSPLSNEPLVLWTFELKTSGPKDLRTKGNRVNVLLSFVIRLLDMAAKKAQAEGAPNAVALRFMAGSTKNSSMPLRS
jgi:hypothetical protein